MIFNFLIFSVFLRGNSRHISITEKIEIDIKEWDDHLENEWLQFQLKYDKKYHETEEQSRIEIFKNNYYVIQEHNKRFSTGEVSYFMGINELADRMDVEIDTLYKGLKIEANELQGGELFDQVETKVPNEIDWRTKNVVTPVKNQASCGSCYTFSATGCLESQYAIKHKKLISLSEQNIVDCTFKYGNFGCHGGYMNNVYRYVHENGGIDTEAQYPYEDKEGKCRYKKNPFEVKGFKNIPTSNETALKIAVATVGPISVGIDATNNFHFYKGGVFTDNTCKNSRNELDHAVLVVGYGTENGKDYWLVKNSWNENWGERGYIKMIRNDDNRCGIATMASYPVL